MIEPLVVGIGGASRPDSSTNRALTAALRQAAEAGARTQLFDGRYLASMPAFDPERPERTEAQQRFLATVREADGVIIATPSYHAGVSGLVKGVLDLLEDLREDRRPYLDGRAVGCIVTASGWQACGATVAALRATVHALRGWPTPLA